MKNKKILIAGGSGFIGQALAARWGKDNRVVILSRQSAEGSNNAYGRKLLSATEGYHITHWRWDGQRVEPHWAAEIDNCDIVINLAGRSVNCRYTRQNRKEILDSRVNATKVIGEAIRGATVPPKLWINAASATIYRHAQDRPQDEFTGEMGNGFSVEVCQRWEGSFFDQRTPFTRKIAMRTAITLGEGGVLVPYLNLLACGIGGRQGDGKQMYSWVHIEDIGRAVEWFFDHPELEGVYNVAAPGPVTNQYFMATLRGLTKQKLALPAPAWLLKAGAALIGTETELVLKSRWVVPTRLEESGFRFQYPRLEEALAEVIGHYPKKKKNPNTKRWLMILAIPVGYALLMRIVFDLSIFEGFVSVMSIGFFLAVPFSIGYLTVILSPWEYVKRRSYPALAPWAPIFVFLWITLLLAIEGWACWLMILPVFLLFASLGGILAGRRMRRKREGPGKLQLSMVILLPFVLSSFEKLLPALPTRYEANTYADIHASADKIWDNVLRVRDIPEKADHGTLTRTLGFPRPIRAELDYAGVGGSRQAIFSKGLVFKEVVLEYQDRKKMHFSITANPHDIPSTTMDKHVVIGGDYFDVLDGTYELEKLGDNLYRLHLYSHFTLKTTFNFYASWWAGWIMKDIQNNILQVIQTRCEGKL
jgi:uncharacterized protein (TIGR01777 family)